MDNQRAPTPPEPDTGAIPENREPTERGPRSPTLQLSGRQLALYKALSECDASLGGMYLGALMVLGQEGNPDCLALAAHGFRELIEKFPRYLDVAMSTEATSETTAPNLADQTRSLQQVWQNDALRSCCASDETWRGEIDAPLRTFLDKARDFFFSFAASHPSKREQIAKIVVAFDPTGRPLPAQLLKLHVARLFKYQKHLESLVHHGSQSSTPDQFRRWLESLEQFLLDRLRPRTFDDHDMIDRLIREGEADDQP